MSKIRHEPAVRSLGLNLPTGRRLEQHTHSWPQLVYAARGVIAVTLDDGSGTTWVVPPMRALWVSPGVPHTLRMRGVVEMRTLYLRPDAAPAIDAPCAVLHVSPLLRELIITIATGSVLHDRTPSDRAKLQLLLDLLIAAPEKPLALPMPADARARRVAEKSLARLGETQTLDTLARGCGASGRTIERLFVEETGMNFGRWKQQARLMEAIKLLGERVPVLTVARQVGYRSPSAFVAAFRKAFGATPASYFRQAER